MRSLTFSGYRAGYVARHQRNNANVGPPGVIQHAGDIFDYSDGDLSRFADTILSKLTVSPLWNASDTRLPMKLSSVSSSMPKTLSEHAFGRLSRGTTESCGRSGVSSNSRDCDNANLSQQMGLGQTEAWGLSTNSIIARQANKLTKAALNLRVHFQPGKAICYSVRTVIPISSEGVFKSSLREC